MQRIFSNLKQGIDYARECLKTYGSIINVPKWQGIQAPKKMFEVDNVYFRACMPQSATALEELVKPDMPWAEDHFLERVSGKSLNPGVQYKNWPSYKDSHFNDKNFRPDGNFTHTYMERYWPKRAGESLSGKKEEDSICNWGIRYPYGDLNDVINLLKAQPFTRQAYLPVWFPEDTGVGHGGRVPCSIGYHFMRKGDDLNIHYMIRACDYIRHFRNDIYLTVRLAQWVLHKLQYFPCPGPYEDTWKNTQLGIFTMDIIHFHVFETERNLI